MQSDMKVLVIGSAGQDGGYLVERMAGAGHAVYGIDRSGLVSPDGARAGPCDIENADDVSSVVREIAPDRVFFLAAYHHSSEEKEANELSIIERSFAVHVSALLNFLDALVASCPAARLFYAASSRVFGAPAASPQNEDTPLNPRCPYGISKTAGIHLIRLYRRHGLYCSAGYLYNHESPSRPNHFVSSRIAKAVVAIERGAQDELVLGDLSATVDWGYAPEYVEAMARIVDLDEATDFIIASGRSHTIEDFVATAFDYAGLDWRDHVKVDPATVRETDTSVPMIGNPSKLRSMTGWEATTKLDDLARIMVDAERQRNA